MMKFSKKVVGLVLLFILLIIVFVSNSSYDNDEFNDRLHEVEKKIIQDYQINGDVEFILKDIDVGAAETRRYPFDNYALIVDIEKLSDIEDKELQGLVSHEMAHLESYSEMNYLQFIIFGTRYLLFDNFKKQVERDTDMKVIEKGYGDELLAYRIYRLETADGEDLKNLNKYYLSVKEIRELI